MAVIYCEMQWGGKNWPGVGIKAQWWPRPVVLVSDAVVVDVGAVGDCELQRVQAAVASGPKDARLSWGIMEKVLAVEDGIEDVVELMIDSSELVLLRAAAELADNGEEL